MQNIERKEHGYAKKWEFIYAEDYQRDGVKFYLREGKYYGIFYDKDKNEFYVDEKNKPLIRFKNSTLFSQYKRVKQPLREGYVSQSYPSITDSIKKQGFLTRYLVKYVLDKNPRIMEVSQADYSRAGNFYKKISIKWIIKGHSDMVSKTNLETLQRNENNFSGLIDYFNPLEFYIEDVKPNIKMDRLDKLNLQNPSRYTGVASDDLDGGKVDDPIKKSKDKKIKVDKKVKTKAQGKTTTRTATAPIQSGY